ncbi:phosphatase PAP2 family protein [Streptomyces sp. CC208A]|uniref:phosphatase PAP2 family protein n=1 Tax=Streptomyces sp. CC208A TaxID=3044573 RepID=UPI0024A83640|nr:phosphatase PAP2 family protein [Streptomyces sp. CC208A]
MPHTSPTAPVPPGPVRRRPAPGLPAAGTALLGAAFAATATLVCALVAAGTTRPRLQNADERWLALMGGPHDGLPLAAATVLDWFGGPLGAVVPLALVAVLCVRRRWWSLLYFLTAYLGGSALVVQVVKYAVDRPRPAGPLVRVDHGSFPSGHAFGAALLVVLVGALFVTRARRPLWWSLGALFTTAMMWSRTWLHAHWLSDTVAGALAGFATGLLLWCAFAPLLGREASRHAVRRTESGSEEAAGPDHPVFRIRPRPPARRIHVNGRILKRGVSPYDTREPG